MTIPVSKVNYLNSPVIEPDYLLQDQATEIFGRNLAERLKIKDGSWKKVMESWNISLQAWKIIKESENDLSSFPKDISCEMQVDDGLIFEASKIYSEGKQEYDDEIIEGKLITPHGSINLKFHNTESMNQLIARFETAFSKQSLDSSIYRVVYSFTLDPTKTATVKPSSYDICGHALREEFGENYYSRTEAINVYKILSRSLNITIEEQAISHNIC